MAHTPRRGICNGTPVQICDSWQLTDILTALQRQSDCCCPFPSNWEIDDIEERTDTFNVNFINGVWSNQTLTQTGANKLISKIDIWANAPPIASGLLFDIGFELDGTDLIDDGLSAEVIRHDFTKFYPNNPSTSDVLSFRFTGNFSAIVEVTYHYTTP